MPEWLIGAVLKTVERASVPWVRIPLPPNLKALRGFFYWENLCFKIKDCFGKKFFLEVFNLYKIGDIMKINKVSANSINVKKTANKIYDNFA